MLEIHEIPDISKYNLILEGLPADKSKLRVVEAFGRAKMVTGFAVFSYEEDCVNIYRCEYGDDIDLCDGILRSILFKASMKGIDTGKCMAQADGENLFTKMHYTKGNETMIQSIASLMNGCKRCKEMI